MIWWLYVLAYCSIFLMSVKLLPRFIELRSTLLALTTSNRLLLFYDDVLHYHDNDVMSSKVISGLYLSQHHAAWMTSRIIGFSVLPELGWSCLLVPTCIVISTWDITTLSIVTASIKIYGSGPTSTSIRLQSAYHLPDILAKHSMYTVYNLCHVTRPYLEFIGRCMVHTIW